MVIARQFAPDEVINTVQVLQPQQVMLEVRFIEASREVGRDLGVQWNMFGSHVAGNIGARQPANKLPITAPTSPTNIPVGEVAAGVLSGGSPFGFLLGRMIAGGTTIDVALNALEQRGLVRNLAEPNLVALSGDTASFLAGGEFPIPVPANLGQITIDYKHYGVGLAFTPTVLKDGVINLKIEPEVSQLDPNNPVHDRHGISVPALIVRRASTTIELRDGQSFMMGGLLLNVSTDHQEQLPWVGDVPVLGTLFRSASTRRTRPISPSSSRRAWCARRRPSDPLKTPLDNTLPANDVDFFLMGKSELTPDGCAPGARTAEALRRPHSRSAERSSQCRRQQGLRAPRRALGAVLALSAVLGGCSDIYYDRRETISLGADDAVDSNKVTQMVDPWPRYSDNRNIAVQRRAHAGRRRALSPSRSDQARFSWDELRHAAAAPDPDRGHQRLQHARRQQRAGGRPSKGPDRLAV